MISVTVVHKNDMSVITILLFVNVSATLCSQNSGTLFTVSGAKMKERDMNMG